AEASGRTLPIVLPGERVGFAARVRAGVQQSRVRIAADGADGPREPDGRAPAFEVVPQARELRELTIRDSTFRAQPPRQVCMGGERVRKAERAETRRLDRMLH